MRMARLFILAVPVLLAGCGEWERTGAFQSPDGKLIAVVEYKGSAACCSDHSRVRLENAKGGTLAEPILIAEVTRVKVHPHWISNDELVIEACDASKIEAQTRILREPIILPGGSINAVRVNLVTASMTTLDGDSFCLQSAEGA